MTAAPQTCGATTCDTPTPDKLCREHLHHLSKDLRQVGWLWTQLGVTASRQDRITHTSPPVTDTARAGDNRVGRAMPGNYITGEAMALPYSVVATEAQHALDGALTAWVQWVHDALRMQPDHAGGCVRPWTVDHWRAHEREWPRDGSAAARSYWLGVHGVPWARTAEQGPAFQASIDYLAWSARSIIDRPPVRWFVGVCLAELAGEVPCKCQLDLYAREGVDTVVCDGWRQGFEGCGASHDVHTRRVTLVAELQDSLLPLELILDALPSLIGVEVKPATARSWRHRGRLVARPGGLYRGGDVLTLALDEATRTGPKRR